VNNTKRCKARFNSTVVNGTFFIKIYGELSSDAITTSKSHIKNLYLKNNINNIVIDISSIDHFDVSGIDILKYFKKVCSLNNLNLYIFKPSDEVKKLISEKFTNLFFTFLHDDEEVFHII